MGSTTYLRAIVAFTVVSTFALFVLLLAQRWLPLNPEHAPNMSALLALNIAINFATTTTTSGAI
jgi:K+-transporting ATPase ATPase A chain